ncbi:MAG: hypothetical protein AAF998_12920 [Bacteroidota bacterium]
MRLHLSSLFLLGALSLLVLVGCKSSSPKAQKEALPEDLALKYREDAARLAVRELNTSRTSGEMEARIPPDRIAFYYDLLSKAYWMSQKDADVPSDFTGIHTLGNPHLKEISVVLENDAEFKSQWANGSTMTANLYLNQLMSRYRLKIQNYREGALGPSLTLVSPTYINTVQLAFILEKIDGIKFAQAEGIAGDGDDVTWGSDSKNAMALKFSKGEGDCPSGCIHRKWWVFYVDAGGEMNYMGTRGQLPSEGGGED